MKSCPLLTKRFLLLRAKTDLSISLLVFQRLPLVQSALLIRQGLPETSQLLRHLANFPLRMALLHLGSAIVREEEEGRPKKRDIEILRKDIHLQSTLRRIRVLLGALAFAHRILAAVRSHLRLVAFGVLLRQLEEAALLVIGHGLQEEKNHFNRCLNSVLIWK
jgi:hypothetical protein